MNESGDNSNPSSTYEWTKGSSLIPSSTLHLNHKIRILKKGTHKYLICITYIFIIHGTNPTFCVNFERKKIRINFFPNFKNSISSLE